KSRPQRAVSCDAKLLIHGLCVEIWPGLPLKAQCANGVRPVFERVLHDFGIEAHIHGKRITNRRRTPFGILLTKSIEIYADNWKSQSQRLLHLPFHELEQVARVSTD